MNIKDTDKVRDAYNEAGLEEFRCILENGLVDDPTVWRNPFLIPGDWVQPSNEEATDFLLRLVKDHEEDGKIPLAGLFRPLGVRRMELKFAPLTLWEVVINAGFDLVSLDILERNAPDWLWPSRNFKNKRRRRVSPFEESDHDRRFISDIFNIFPTTDDKSDSNSRNISPTAIAQMVIGDKLPSNKKDALSLIIFCIGLSVKNNNRLRILYPHDYRTISGSNEFCPEWSKLILPPQIRRQAGTFSAKFFVAVDNSLVEITAAIKPDQIPITKVKKISTIAPALPDILIGPGRTLGTQTELQSMKK